MYGFIFWAGIFALGYSLGVLPAVSLYLIILGYDGYNSIEK